MRRITFIICFWTLAVHGCVGQEYSTAFDAAVQLGQASDQRLKEVSGIVASRANPGLLWVHNDSGNAPELFLIDEKMQIRSVVTLQGAMNRDWEDIAQRVDPTSGKNFLYVGDIGDNDGAKEFKYIYVLEEPKIGPSQSNLVLRDFKTIVVRLEDGSKDSETLLADPLSDDFFVITKREDPISVYRFKASFSDTVTARRVATLTIPEVVSADYSSKRGLLLKNYESVYFWPARKGFDIEKLLQETPARVPYEREPQGEAITWSHDATSFYTLSEMKKKKPSFLFKYQYRE
jgi:hypothetical protein